MSRLDAWATDTQRFWQSRAARRAVTGALFSGGPSGNERLTVLTGVLLIVLLAALGVTILRIGALLEAHMFLGMLLIGPVLLKMASTGYRFVRYYTTNPRYRRRGAPATYLRVLAPGVLVSTVTVFASGVALLVAGPASRNPLLLIHKVSFIGWGVLSAVHVLGHSPELLRALRPAHTPRYNSHTAGEAGRIISLLSALVAGLVLALITEPQFAAWVAAHRFTHPH